METPICQLAVLEVSWLFWYVVATQERHETTHFLATKVEYSIVEVLYGSFPLLRLARQSPCQRWRNKICHCVLPAHAGDCLPAAFPPARRVVRWALLKGRSSGAAAKQFGPPMPFGHSTPFPFKAVPPPLGLSCMTSSMVY